MSWAENELKVIRWAEDRRIIPNSNPMAQAIKTHEELGELMSALHRCDHAEMVDAYGDILVTLIIGASLADVDLTRCLEAAYEQIKDRRGTLRADGVFVKESA
jgi:hypothetical protein